MSKVAKTIKLTEATFKSVLKILGTKLFYAQNPEDSLRKCDSENSFEYWKGETLVKYPNASLVITNGEQWHSEVRVSDPFFQTDRDTYIGNKTHYLQSIGY